MADEITMTPAVPADVSSPAKAKKTRAPRKPRVAPEAVTDMTVSASVRKTRGPGKKAAAANAARPAAPATRAPAPAIKAAAAKVQPAKAARKVEGAGSDADGFADLLKLEKENQELRTALSRKLRSENADLRKKLGLA
jgi:hypothetical protein